MAISYTVNRMNTYVAVVRAGSTLDRIVCDVPEKWNKNPVKWFSTFLLPKGTDLVALIPKSECEQIAAILEEIP